MQCGVRAKSACKEAKRARQASKGKVHAKAACLPATLKMPRLHYFVLFLPFSPVLLPLFAAPTTMMSIFATTIDICHAMLDEDDIIAITIDKMMPRHHAAAVCALFCRRHVLSNYEYT